MIIQANALHLPIASDSVQCVVTSPPYWGLRDYGITGQLGLERTPEEYVANMVAVFREVWRVLRSDGTLWLNLGDSYAGSGMTGGTNSKEYSEKRIGRMFHGNRRDTVFGLKQKDLVGIPWRVAFALQADGWYLRSDIIWSKPNPMPESVTDRPTKAHEYLFLLAKSERYYFDQDAVRTPQHPSSLKRLETGWNGNKKRDWPKENQHNDFDRYMGKSKEEIDSLPGRNIRSVWHIATQPWSGAHFATFPEKLVEPCILAGSRHGDLVLDPFVGSGTVIRVAVRHQRKGIGCDLNIDYLTKQADKRMRNVQIEMVLQ